MFDNFDFDGMLDREAEREYARRYMSDAEQARLDAEEREADAPRYSFAQVVEIFRCALEDLNEQEEAEGYADELFYEDGLTSLNQIKLTLSACLNIDNAEEFISECH